MHDLIQNLIQTPSPLQVVLYLLIFLFSAFTISLFTSIQAQYIKHFKLFAWPKKLAVVSFSLMCVLALVFIAQAAGNNGTVPPDGPNPAPANPFAYVQQQGDHDIDKFSPGVIETLSKLTPSEHDMRSRFMIADPTVAWDGTSATLRSCLRRFLKPNLFEVFYREMNKPGKMGVSEVQNEAAMMEYLEKRLLDDMGPRILGELRRNDLQ